MPLPTEGGAAGIMFFGLSVRMSILVIAISQEIIDI